MKRILSGLVGRFSPKVSASSSSDVVGGDDWSPNLTEAIRAALNGGGSSRKPLSIPAVYNCIRLISNPVATLPLHVKREDGESVHPAKDHPLWKVLTRKPNSWQTPEQFRRMCMHSTLLRGDAICQVQTDIRDNITALVPLQRDRCEVSQKADLSLKIEYERPSGGYDTFSQGEFLRTVGLTLDGVEAVSPLTFARETLELAFEQRQHGINYFRNGTNVGSVVEVGEGKPLNTEQLLRLKESIEAYRNSGKNSGGTLLLEEGAKFKNIGLSMADAEWLDSRKFSSSEIAQYFGVPPHMIGDTEKATSWGSGIEQQTNAFIAYTLEHYLSMWEQSLNLTIEDPDVYVRFNRNALVQGDFKTRVEALVKMVQFGIISPDEARAYEDMNPRKDGNGGVYYDPPNTSGDRSKEKSSQENSRELKVVA